MKSSGLMTKTVILGILAEGQMHGYEIRKRLQRELGESAEINFGSIYYGLKSYVERGWVKHIRDESVKGNPERSVYRITSRGRAQLAHLLETTLSDTSDSLKPLEAALNFMENLPASRAREILTDRHEQMKRRYDEALTHDPNPDENPRAGMIREYRLYQLGAEVIWLKNLLLRL